MWPFASWKIVSFKQSVTISVKRIYLKKCLWSSKWYIFNNVAFWEITGGCYTTIPWIQVEYFVCSFVTMCFIRKKLLKCGTLTLYLFFYQFVCHFYTSTPIYFLSYSNFMKYCHFCNGNIRIANFVVYVWNKNFVFKTKLIKFAEFSIAPSFRVFSQIVCVHFVNSF